MRFRCFAIVSRNRIVRCDAAVGRRVTLSQLLTVVFSNRIVLEVGVGGDRQSLRNNNSPTEISSANSCECDCEVKIVCVQSKNSRRQ